jgi:ribonucleoside-diphosphate reductase beta chain
MQQQIHWLPEEVPMADDVKDWRAGENAIYAASKNQAMSEADREQIKEGRGELTPGEMHLLTQILRFFTQGDIEVNNCYIKHYSKIFEPTEIKMMLASFSNMETIHVDAYSHLLDTLGMPEVEYQAFLKYKEMKDKYDYMQTFNVDSKEDVGKTLAVFGAFTEGLQLFASFAMLLNFQRFGKMRGMGQIVAWSVRDETLHTNSIIKLFKTFIQENPEVWTKKFQDELIEICETIVEHEDAFIDLAFEIEGAIRGLTATDVKLYIRYIADHRLTQLGLPAIYHIGRNPLPWMDEILNAPEHTNFFENRVTEYAKAATKGSWEQAFA